MKLGMYGALKTLSPHEMAMNAVYKERNQCVALVARMAIALGCKAGLGKHDPSDTSWDPEWLNIVFIDLPTGQVSWHFHDRELPLFEGLPAYEKPWDGHSTPEKYERVGAAFR